MLTYSFDLNPTESVFSIVKGNPLKSPGSIRAKRMASVVNALVQLFYSTFIQPLFKNL